MTRIAFRVDASAKIGTGHFARCLTLASALGERGARVRFLSSQLPANLATCLAGQGYEVAEISAAPPEQDAALCIGALSDFRPDWLVVDHYQLDARWEAKLRPHCEQIFVIDDMADRPHNCDLLLDQNFNPTLRDRYRLLTPTNTVLLQGPRYALLPPGFAANRTRRPAVSGQVKRVLICFGGSDPGNHTAATLTAIKPFTEAIEHIDVAIGTLNPHQEAISRLCGDLPGAHLHCPAGNMPELLLRADLAIGAGGTMNWERACLGVPSLAFGIADNQVSILEELIEGGFVGGHASMPIADSRSIARWIGIALDSPAFLRGLAIRSRTLVDGRGAERVARHLMPRPLAFRTIEPADSDDLLRWRNTPEIREASINTGEIDLPTHRAWLQAKLADSSCRLLIAESNGKPVGVVRFDLAQPNATISVYRVPNSQPESAGLIEQATAWLRLQHPGIKRIIAQVKPGNSTSLSAFRAAGYCHDSTSLVFEWKHP